MFFFSFFPLIFHKDSAALDSALFLSRFEAHGKESLKIAAERSTSMSIRLVCLTRQQQQIKMIDRENKKMIFHNLNASPR